MDGLSYDYYSGWPKDIISNLAKSIGMYGVFYDRVKIGITNNPEIRFRAHRRDGWDRMVVKYMTKSVKHANEIEKYFIERNEWMDNIYKGWSNLGQGEDFYVYILLADKYE